ncbi:MAG: aldo/keto reductase [Conexivisphaera sp.]|jgi:aryl-alcohol dehydrogenase-like predicted oxidoreductase
MVTESIELGRSGIRVSRIGLGTWQAGGRQWGDDVDDRSIVDAIRRAHELGLNLLDTAEVYGDGHSEEVVGRALAEVGRENFVVATKVHGAHLRHDELLRAAEASMRRLGVKYIDLYQIHWPDPWEQIPLRETMRAMEELYVQGKIRAIGVSNFAVRDLEEARSFLSKTDVASNQVRYNMLQREVEEEVVPYCRRNGISIIAWSPLAQGALTGKYREGRVPRDRIRSGNEVFRPENMRRIEPLLRVLERIASRRGVEISQVALNWLLARDAIPIPGAKNPRQVEVNAGAMGWRLDEREMREIEEVLVGIDIDYL